MAKPDSAPAVETEALCKTYRAHGNGMPVEALKDVSLTIPRGSFFALLGPNGAGKSTFINILAGLVNRTAGTARICGFDTERDMRAARRAIGVVPQELNIDPFFSPRQLLDVQAGLYGVPSSRRRTDEILGIVELTSQARAYARTLSGGMRRRLLVAKAMVHSPQVLVLDEPTAGVDVDLRRRLWVAVKELNARGVTILLTTHYLEEAQALCDHIAIIDQGRLIASEPKKTLMKRLDAKEMTVILADPIKAVPEALAALEPRLERGRRLTFRFPPSRTGGGQILAAVQAAGLTVRDVSTREADLEEIFLQLTRRDTAGRP